MLLQNASRHDHIVKEAQRFKGGVDAKATESKIISTGIVSSTAKHTDVGDAEQRTAAEDDTVAVAVAAPILENPSHRPSKRGGRP